MSDDIITLSETHLLFSKKITDVCCFSLKAYQRQFSQSVQAMILNKGGDFMEKRRVPFIGHIVRYTLNIKGQ